MSSNPPKNLKPEEIPQLVFLTFDDSINSNVINYYNDIVKGRFNPNGCPIGLTYYLSHDWTDYSLVNQLYNEGHEIASHTVS